MSTEELRSRLMTSIDNLLAKPMLVPLPREDRGLFSALRGYVAVMPIYELERLRNFVVQAEQASGDAGAQPEPTP